MGNVFTELKRRHIYRVAAAYAVVAWLLLQIVNNTVPLMQAPAWVGQFCLLLLALGFPLAIFFAWTREVTPADAQTPARATLTDAALIGTLLIVIGLISYQQFAATGGSTAKSSGVDEARLASLHPATAISLAVLPFANLSGDPTQDFFSDGMTEEITSALAKVPDLRVVARTSAFEFKNKNLNIKVMGEQLGATHLIEGSVRKAGNRLRITAQLVKADDGTHIWAEDYDRELTDVFAIQEGIARAITTSLRMPLGLKPGEQLVSNRAIDPESYAQFLRGKQALLRARTAYADQLAILEPVVEKNPNYAPGWAALARAYRYAAQFGRYGTPEESKRTRGFYEAKVDVAISRSLALDPDLIDAKVMLARTQSGSRAIARSEDILSAVLAQDPNNPDALDYYGGLLSAVGRHDESVSARQRVHQIEPFAPLYTGNLAESL